MMHGHEKSDLVIVVMKPANKAKEAHCGGVCRGERSGVGGAKGGGQGEYAPAQHVLDPEPGSRDKRAGAYTATFAVTHPRWEPYAGKPHVRFCAGRAMKRTSLPLQRREFITLLGGAVAAWPLAVHAQLPSRMRHVGVFLGLTASADDPGAGEILRPFKAAMAEVGWIEDQNIRLDYRFGGGDLAKIHAAAGDLVTLAPDLIMRRAYPPLKPCA